MKFQETTLNDKNNKPILKGYYSKAQKGKRVYREHHHTECEFCMILSGSGIYTVHDKMYDFNAGDIFLFSGDEVHCITDISEDLLILNIHFAPQILWYDSDSVSALKIIFARNSKFENRIDRNNIHTKIIADNIKKLYNEMNEKRDGYEIISKYLLFSILITLVREYDYIDRSLGLSSIGNTIQSMRKALDYIEKNLTGHLTLKDISSRACMAPTYFSAIFKKMNGISPWEYITIKRVEMAVELLKNTDLTKLDIAMQCGFTSSSNFYKAFSKITGKTPSEYQK